MTASKLTAQDDGYYLKGKGCHTHGGRLVAVRGAGHMHDGEEHGIFTYACPHLDYPDGFYGPAKRCSYERTITKRCPEEAA